MSITVKVIIPRKPAEPAAQFSCVCEVTNQHWAGMGTSAQALSERRPVVSCGTAWNDDDESPKNNDNTQ